MIGARIRQARLIAGLSQKELAEAVTQGGLAISPAAISGYETGKSHPPIDFMLNSAQVLGVRVSYLFHQPETTVDWTAFRRRSSLGKKGQEAIKAYALDIAELQIELKSALYPSLPRRLPREVAVNGLEDAEGIADQVRNDWDVGDRPLDNLVQTAEDRGVIVVAWKGDEEFDGLSGWCGEHPVAVINQKKPADRIRFTLAHEIGHLVMENANPDDDEEQFAHRFAAALLVPADHAIHELGASRESLGWEELKYLKRKYGISMAAWIRRAKDLEIISEECYTELMIDLSSRRWRKSEPGSYLGDEEPILLRQMATRAMAEGVISPARINTVYPEAVYSSEELAKDYHLNVYDLLGMPEAERNEIMAKAFAAAAEDEDYEIFEANEIYDEYDELYDKPGEVFDAGAQ